MATQNSKFTPSTSFIEEALCQKQAHLLATGALAVETGRHTGRAARSRFFVEDEQTRETIDWNEVNRPYPEAEARDFFRALQRNLASERVFEVHAHVGPFPVELITTSSWHATFAQTMFREQFIAELQDQVAQSVGGFGTLRIWHDPYSKASDYGIQSPEEAFILLDCSNFSIGICGTAYAGELKKAAFSMANYLLPLSGVLPLHGAANCRKDGSRTCLLVGLSGTGKTTLSTENRRFLIGDDEIAWSERGLSNLEGGCYASVDDLKEEQEPEVFQAVNKFGSLLENVEFDSETRLPDFSSKKKSSNTRGAYQLGALESVFDPLREASPPETIVFLSADAFGALPAVQRLDHWQARYHFLSGYTSKIPGTELGVNEPKATFSACFGAPFMPRSALSYVDLLSHYLEMFEPTVWLLNTGWIGGFANGPRFPLALTRHLLEVIQNDDLQNSHFERHPVFGFDVMTAASGIDSELLKIPHGPQVEELAKRFIANEEKFPEAREIHLRGGPSGARAGLDSDEWTSISLRSPVLGLHLQ